METTFRFKQFGIADGRCGMKIGTDAVALGAWVDCTRARRVVDVGAGSGIIGLMIAQRQPECMVTAIELESGAAADCAENFAASPFASRMELWQGNFADWSPREPVDLIVSNPPYFSTGFTAPDAARAAARHGASLTYSTLICWAARRLAPDGRLAMVAPAELEADIVYRGEMAHLKVRRLTYLCAVEGREAVRILVEMSPTDGHLDTSTLAIRRPDNSYTPDFINLTREFYLYLK